MPLIRTARNILSIIRQRTDKIGVAFSGGKDSLACMQLASEIFKAVRPYILVRTRGLQCTRWLCAPAERRWGVRVAEILHHDLSTRYCHAVLQPHWSALDALPRVGWREIEVAVRAKLDVDWLVYGWRRTDSLTRAIILSNNQGIDWIASRVFPLARWGRKDVLAFLRVHKIIRPPTFGRAEQGGLTFEPAALAWIKRYFPEDMKKIRKEYPYVVAIEAKNETTDHD